MTRTTHRFSIGHEIIEAYYIIAEPEEWAAMPESKDRSWSVYRTPTTVYACTLGLPAWILATPTPPEDLAAIGD